MTGGEDLGWVEGRKREGEEGGGRRKEGGGRREEGGGSSIPMYIRKRWFCTCTCPQEGRVVCVCSA